MTPARYTVFGNPIDHSLSPTIHAAFAAQAGMALQYTKTLVPPHAFERCLQAFIKEGGQGANVTLPLKAEALTLATQASDTAQQAGAANCLTFKNDEIWADNTDGIGLITDLTEHLQLSLRHKRILVIGAGGAARGITGPLLARAPATLTLANRTLETAETLAKQFASSGPITALSLEALLGAEPFDLIIHATSAGLSGQILTLPSTLLHPNTLCYDLAYGKAAQPFLTWAANAGCQHSSDGLGMLVEQAAAAFHAWFGVYPNTPPVLTQLRG